MLFAVLCFPIAQVLITGSSWQLTSCKLREQIPEMTWNFRGTCRQSIPRACDARWCFDWCKKKSAGSTRARAQTITLARVGCYKVNIFPLFFSAELSRFHHKKDFTYNYEGETVSSVAGASSARSGLRIRARCVVKAVGPCQHVLKVGKTSYGLPQNFDFEWHVTAFKLLCLFKILPRIKPFVSSYDHHTRFDHLRYLGFFVWAL